MGQNKNNAMIQYLAWRVIAGLNESVELSFMLVGHTKFAPDRFFGLFKKTYRKSIVDTMEDVVHAEGTFFYRKKHPPVNHQYLRYSSCSLD